MFIEQDLTMTEAIKEFREVFLSDYAEEWCQTYYDINNGECVTFADEFIEAYGHRFGEDLTSFVGANFCQMDEYDFCVGWDTELLTTHWPKIRPLYGLSWEEVGFFADDYHCFLYFQGKFYDAECPQGVENFLELPLYERKAYYYVTHCKSQAKTLEEARQLYLQG